MFDFGHARPFVVGMNGTFSGVFIPQMIPLDTFVFAQPALPELATPPEAPSAPSLAQFLAARLDLSADSFVIAPMGQPAAPSAHVLPGFVHFATTFSPLSATLPSSGALAHDFGWDAPVLPVSDLHQWDMPVVSSWFDQPSFDSFGWDLFFY